jgi:hypothetical protein
LFQATVAVAVVLGFLAHEAAHWAAGVGLGYHMEMSLNRAGPVPGQTVTATHAMLISAAGPMFTLIQGFVAAVLASRGAVLAYPFVFAAFLMRLTASAISLINPNDEMRVGDALGVGSWTLPVLVTFALLALTVYASRQLGVSWRANAVAYVVGSATVTAMVFGDRLLGA